MANAFTKQIAPLWDNILKGWESSMTVSNAVRIYSPPDADVQRSNNVVYRPMDYQFDTVSGLDVSGATKTDLIQRMVPAVLGAPNNVVFELSADQMRDPWHMTQAGIGAGRDLAAAAEVAMANAIANKAANVVTQTGVFSWDLAATARRVMKQKGIGSSASMKMVLNPLDAQKIAGELGSRAFFQGKTEQAFVRNQIPDVAGTPTFEADVMPNVAARGTVTGTTVNGAQSHTVTAMTDDLPTDNRQFVLTVGGANIANIKVGDCFTAGVNSVHNITKQDTGELQTFRVIGVSGGGTQLTIYPAPVATGPYKNVTAALANSQALTFINSVTKASSVLFDDSAVEFFVGRYEFPTDMGPKVTFNTTPNGLPLTMSYAFDHMTGKVSVRLHYVATPVVLNPDKTALLLASQT